MCGAALWPLRLNDGIVNRGSSALVGTSSYSAPAMRYRSSHQPHIYKQVLPAAARSRHARDAWLQKRARSDGNIFQVRARVIRFKSALLS